MKRSIAAALVLILGGCATASRDVPSSHVSPTLYQDYDCQQVYAETARIRGRTIAVGGRLDQAARNDQALTAAGMLVFWPALVFLGGTASQQREYSRLQGEYTAIQAVAIEKKCTGDGSNQNAASQPPNIPTAADPTISKASGS